MGSSPVDAENGIQAMKFGEIDKKDFLIPPFAFFYFYIVFGAAVFKRYGKHRCITLIACRVRNATHGDRAP